MSKRYYSMEQVGKEANINIYGDISSYACDETVTLKSLSAALDEMVDVSSINVYINSYGGEVAEGIAIYNALKRHKAKIKTFCDGFAASIASVIFMAGDERIMNDSSALMIHNAWTFGMGNAQELRKQADDLDKITQLSITAYLAHSNLSEEEIKSMLDNETWILPEEALQYGFATSIEKTAKAAVSQNVKSKLLDIIRAYQSEEAEEDEEEKPPEKQPETEEETADEEETPEAETEQDETEEETSENEETNNGEAAEMFSGFFNAIMKM